MQTISSQSSQSTWFSGKMSAFSNSLQRGCRKLRCGNQKYKTRHEIFSKSVQIFLSPRQERQSYWSSQQSGVPTSSLLPSVVIVLLGGEETRVQSVSFLCVTTRVPGAVFTGRSAASWPTWTWTSPSAWARRPTLPWVWSMLSGTLLNTDWGRRLH